MLLQVLEQSAVDPWEVTAVVVSGRDNATEDGPRVRIVLGDTMSVVESFETMRTARSQAKKAIDAINEATKEDSRNCYGYPAQLKESVKLGAAAEAPAAQAPTS